ncbi:MAG: glycoside hydrolase family 32 protein [Cyclobacteriaceae bacterium]|nr:glycoside hydrolase family 32 protein [Cyclobacteriaceae bacterium]
MQLRDHAIYLALTTLIITSCSLNRNQPEDNALREKHRPQFHFSPAKNWMNDPNGMVFYNGEYHLSYQYYPDGNVWGPMHWGHAVTKDLIRWEHLPIALYPDSLGYIFSGSAVVDWQNTTGFGSLDSPALVAIFTYHDPEQEKAGSIDYQTQGIAYSLDNGRTWIKYNKNPVLHNPGIKDFRDPKVFWYEPTGSWIMILAVLDHVQLFRSPDLKQWEKLSEFGVDQGSHGGVWECPDLFPLTVNGTEKWVMLVSLNNGAPNGGSGTQYFIGTFDGITFVNKNPAEKILWIDYGKDNYAGVTWSDVPKEVGRKLFIGWMSNWNYANVVPTTVWRSAMTLPRELKLIETPAGTRLISEPVPELKTLREEKSIREAQTLEGSLDLSSAITSNSQYDLFIAFDPDTNQGFTLELSNAVNEQLLITYNTETNSIQVDRTKAGRHDFSTDFGGVHVVPREIKDPVSTVRLIVDQSSIELFADDGLTVMTELMFPTELFTQLKLHTQENKSLSIEKIEITSLKRIW